MNNVGYFTKTRFASILGLDNDKAEDIFDYLEKEELLRLGEVYDEEYLETACDEARDEGYDQGFEDARHEYEDAADNIVDDIRFAIEKHSVIIDGQSYILTENIERVLG